MAKVFTEVSRTTSGNGDSRRTGLIVVEMTPTVGYQISNKARYSVIIDWEQPRQSVVLSEIWCMGEGWREVVSLFGDDPNVLARLSVDDHPDDDRLTMMLRIVNEMLRPQTKAALEW